MFGFVAGIVIDLVGLIIKLKREDQRLGSIVGCGKKSNKK